MNLQPTNDYILVEPVKEEEITKGGIVIPETAREEKSMRGKVISVGPGKVNEKGERTPVRISVGQMIVFKKYAPDEVKIDNQEYYFIKEDDVLAIIG